MALTTNPSGGITTITWTATAPNAKATTLLRGYAYHLWVNDFNNAKTTVPDFETITNTQIRNLIDEHLRRTVRNMGVSGDALYQEAQVEIVPLVDELT